MSNPYLIKPFSPHLLIYKIQSSSIYSILHRISAIFFIFYFLFSIFLFFLSTNIHFYNFIILNKTIYFSFIFIKYFLIKIGLFHILNGLKIILWNFNYLENNLIFYNTNNFVVIFFLIFTIF